LRDLVIKVVRELGHPELAREFESGAGPKNVPVGKGDAVLAAVQSTAFVQRLRQLLETAAPPNPAHVANLVWEHFGPDLVFARDLLAAQADGLLTLGTGSSCLGLAAVSVPHGSAPLDLIEQIASCKQRAGDALIFDAPEHYFAGERRSPNEIAAWVRALGIDESGCEPIVNLNALAPPADIVDLASGPLFPNISPTGIHEANARMALELLEQGATLSKQALHVAWHLGERDFEEARRPLLLRTARLAQEGADISFVFDRPRKPHRLGEGIDRTHRTSLMSLGLHLPQLAEQMGTPRTPERFLAKLVVLVRLALSAGTQKRSYLRGLAGYAEGFLLERARLVIVPVGLDEVVRSFLRQGCCSTDPAPLALGRQILERLRTLLEEDGKACLLDACLDSSTALSTWLHRTNPASDPRFAAGVTTWDAQATPLRQMTACGALHHAARGGTAQILLPDRDSAGPEELAEWLQFAWKKTDIVSLRFERRGPPESQETADWDKGAPAGSEGGADKVKE